MPQWHVIAPDLISSCHTGLENIRHTGNSTLLLGEASHHVHSARGLRGRDLLAHPPGQVRASVLHARSGRSCRRSQVCDDATGLHALDRVVLDDNRSLPTWNRSGRNVVQLARQVVRTKEPKRWPSPQSFQRAQPPDEPTSFPAKRCVRAICSHRQGQTGSRCRTSLKDKCGLRPLPEANSKRLGSRPPSNHPQPSSSPKAL